MEQRFVRLRQALTPNILLYQLAYLVTCAGAQILGLRYLTQTLGFRLPFIALAIYSAPSFVLAVVLLVYRKSNTLPGLSGSAGATTDGATATTTTTAVADQLYGFGSRDLALGAGSEQRGFNALSRWVWTDYVWIGVPSVAAQLCLVWSVTRTEFGLFAAVFVLQLDTLWLTLCNARRARITKGLSAWWTALVTCLLVVGVALALLVTTTHGSLALVEFDVLNANDYAWVQGLVGLCVSRALVAVRGTLAHRTVLRRSRGRTAAPGSGAGDGRGEEHVDPSAAAGSVAARYGLSSTRATVDVDADVPDWDLLEEALHNRHSASDAEYDTEHLQSLDRVFGSGLYGATAMGLDVRSSTEIVHWSESVALCPCALLLAFVSYVAGWPDAADVGNAFEHWYDALGTALTLAALSAAKMAEPAVTAVVTLRSGVVWHATRHVLVTAALSACAVLLFREDYSSAMSFGYFVFALSYIVWLLFQYSAWQKRLQRARERTTTGGAAGLAAAAGQTAPGSEQAAAALGLDGRAVKGAGHVVIQRVPVGGVVGAADVTAAGGPTVSASRVAWSGLDSVISAASGGGARSRTGSQSASGAGAAAAKDKDKSAQQQQQQQHPRDRCAECGLAGNRHHTLVECSTCGRAFHVPCYRGVLPLPTRGGSSSLAAPGATPDGPRRRHAASSPTGTDDAHVLRITRCVYDPSAAAGADDDLLNGNGGANDDLQPLLDVLDAIDLELPTLLPAAAVGSLAGGAPKTHAKK